MCLCRSGGGDDVQNSRRMRETGYRKAPNLLC